MQRALHRGTAVCVNGTGERRLGDSARLAVNQACASLTLSAGNAVVDPGLPCGAERTERQSIEVGAEAARALLPRARCTEKQGRRGCAIGCGLRTVQTS